MDESKFNQPNKKLSRGIVFLFILILIILMITVIAPAVNMNKANRLLSEGRGEEAAAVYSQYTNHFLWGGSAQQRFSNALIETGKKALEEHDYERAIKAFDLLGNDGYARKKAAKNEYAEYAYANEDYETAASLFAELSNTSKEKEAYGKAGDQHLASGDYNKAIEDYGKASMDEAVLSVHITWAEALASREQYVEAAEQYRLAGRNDQEVLMMYAQAEKMIRDGTTEGICELLEPYPGAKTAELIFRAQSAGNEDPSDGNAVASAAAFGKAVSDPDTQLRYSKLLLDAGYDLKQVYPDGVPVKMNLARYNVVNANLGTEIDNMDLSKIVVFSREWDEPSLALRSSGSGYSPETFLDNEYKALNDGKYSCSIRLHPELISELLDTYQAWDLDSCTVYLILDDGYIPEGSLIIRQSAIGIGSETTSYTGLISYSAYESIAFFDKKDTNKALLEDICLNRSAASNAVIGNAYSDAGIDITELDLSKIQEALADRESEDSKEVLNHYDESVIRFVENHDWGDYVLIPDTDESGEQHNFKGTTNNIGQWNIPKYMIGVRNENWIHEKLADDVLTKINMALLILQVSAQ